MINTSAVELKGNKEINYLKDSLILKTENFLSCLDKVDTLSKCSKIDTKLAESLLVSTLVVLEFHPNDKKDNINFLVEFISLSMK